MNFGHDTTFMERLRDAENLKEHKGLIKAIKYTGNIGDLATSDTYLTFNYSEPVQDWVIQNQ